MVPQYPEGENYSPMLLNLWQRIIDQAEIDKIPNSCPDIWNLSVGNWVTRDRWCYGWRLTGVSWSARPSHSLQALCSVLCNCSVNKGEEVNHCGWQRRRRRGKVANCHVSSHLLSLALPSAVTPPCWICRAVAGARFRGYISLSGTDANDPLHRWEVYTHTGELWVSRLVLKLRLARHLLLQLWQLLTVRLSCWPSLRPWLGGYTVALMISSASLCPFGSSVHPSRCLRYKILLIHSTVAHADVSVTDSCLTLVAPI